MTFFTGSGLDLNDYKGKKRRRNKLKKLDKLIIRNISVSTEPNAQTICSSILDKTIKNLPCFEKLAKSDSIVMNRDPVVIKIRKNMLPTTSTTSEPQKSGDQPLKKSVKRKVRKNIALRTEHEKKLEKEQMLRKQLNIDMVENGKIFTSNVILGRRKAKTDAKKALVKPSAKVKKAENTVEPEKETELDEKVVESILDKIMGDTDSNSSLEDVIKPPNDNQGKEISPTEKPTATPTKVMEPVGEPIPEKMSK